MTAQNLSFLDGQSETGRVTLRSFDADTPQARKEAGMAAALDNAGREWREEALQCIREWFLTLPDQSEVVADDWRDVVPIEPHHPNAWGPLAGLLARYGWIEFAQRFQPSRQTQGNCNPLRVWRINRAAVQRGKPEQAEKARGAA